MTPTEFLDKYNPDRTVACAISKAIAVAAQRNPLYAPNVLIQAPARIAARQRWGELLQALQKVYAIPRDTVRYEQDIVALKSVMNNEHAACFSNRANALSNYDPGFRISHAQKSIAVFLKHLWCMNLIQEPPQCPIDSQILKKAGSRHPETRWGYVNTIEEHRRKVAILNAERNRVSPHLSLAAWELEVF